MLYRTYLIMCDNASNKYKMFSIIPAIMAVNGMKKVFDSKIAKFLFLVILSCQNDSTSKEQDIPTYTIKNNEISNVCDASSWLELKIIPLSTDTTGAYISETLSYFKLIKDRVVLVDLSLLKITTFDLTGNFVWQLFAGDEGYESFSSIGHIEFYEDRFEVYDEQKAIFYYYNYEGLYLNKTYIGFDFEDKILLSDNLFAFNTYGFRNPELNSPTSNTSFSIYLVDSSGVIGRQLPYLSRINERMQYETKRNFSKYKENIYYHRVFTDTVFSFNSDSNSWFPSYIINFDKNHLGNDFFVTYNGNSIIDYVQKNKNPYLWQTIRIKEYIISLYMKIANNSYSIILSCFDSNHSSENKEICNASLIRVQDKLLPIPIAFGDGNFAVLISKYNYNLFQKINSYEQFPNNETIDEIVASMGEETDEENPLLILYKIKE